MTSMIIEDMHVHSTFSDGQATVGENVQQALNRGLRRLCCVDHVRRDTAWVPEFVAAVRRGQSDNPALAIFCGLEAKILNQSGALDVPEMDSGADYVYAADHRFPLGDSCYSPQSIREQLRDGVLSEAEALCCLVEATRNAMLSRSGLVLAHLFSILPKVGLTEERVEGKHLDELARTARRTGAMIEIDERWRCPSLRTVRTFRDAGVPVFCSTDSHRLEAVGRYTYVQEVWDRLNASNAV